MFEGLAAWQYVGFASGALAMAVALVTIYFVSRPKRDIAAIVEPEVKRDWMATGRINLLADPRVMDSPDEDSEANFVIRVEETRLVADISGSPGVETRWRKPTKREARHIVRRYHENMPERSDPYTQAASPFGGRVVELRATAS